MATPLADHFDYRNFQIDFWFAKYLISPRYLTYIKYILDTETGLPTKIDLHFHLNRAHNYYFDSITAEDCLTKIRELCDKYENKLTLELRQDFIADFIVPGISNGPLITPAPPVKGLELVYEAKKPEPPIAELTPSEKDLSGNILVKKKLAKKSLTQS